MHVDNISEQVKLWKYLALFWIYFSIVGNYSWLKINNKSNTKPDRSLGAQLKCYWRHVDRCQHNYNSAIFLHNDRLLATVVRY